MIPAELADRVDDLIHVPQFHTVHQLIQLLEILFDLGIIQAVALAVSFI